MLFTIFKYTITVAVMAAAATWLFLTNVTIHLATMMATCTLIMATLPLWVANVKHDAVAKQVLNIAAGFGYVPVLVILSVEMPLLIAVIMNVMAFIIATIAALFIRAHLNDLIHNRDSAYPEIGGGIDI